MDFSYLTRERKDIHYSKTLSWILRHAALDHDLQFDTGGFIDVEKILNLSYFQKCSVDDIKRIVENDKKTRFALRFKENDNDVLQIRANQGHSIPVGVDDLFKEITFDSLPLFVYHGTYFSRLESIKSKGLSRMNRNHIHFTKYLPVQDDIISGMRRSCEIAIMIDSYKAFKEGGIKFYLSANEVILSPGNEEGVIPPIYFRDFIEVCNKKMKKKKFKRSNVKRYHNK